ncbi:hypothetical protein ACFWHQ_07675 [Streptomyces sp. NPDC060334]|uniref:hypothetical protein n=1 Tax=Streptomyces sp. NPDC060334 TaxID=3347099 RepID=UPI00365499A7
MDSVVGTHQWGDLVPDAGHFVWSQTDLAQAGLSGSLVLGGELGVEEGLKKVTPHVGPGPSGNPVVDAEAFQFGTPFSGDEDGLSRDGADLRWGSIRVGVPHDRRGDDALGSGVCRKEGRLRKADMVTGENGVEFHPVILADRKRVRNG